MRIRVEPRLTASRRYKIAVTLASFLFAVPLIAIIFMVYGVNPIEAYSVVLNGAFGTYSRQAETITKSIPLMLCAVGLSLAFETKFFNIGAEGQFHVGAMFSTWVALNLSDLPGYLLLPLMAVAGFLGGWLWGLIPTLLKVLWKTNEVITTLLMNYISLKILAYLVYGPWRGADTWGFPYTSKFNTNAWLPVVEGTRLHYPTLILAIIAALVIYLVVKRTRFGFETRIVGKNPDAAHYLGVNNLKVYVLVMLVSGGLAGLAGFGEVAGIQHRLRENISPGYGFTAIIVAWLGRLHPISTAFMAVVFGGLLVGGEMIQIKLNLPFATIQLFNGVFLLSILMGEYLLKNRIVLEADS